MHQAVAIAVLAIAVVHARRFQWGSTAVRIGLPRATVSHKEQPT
jgi:hypothetical protein